jgi:hypothetical protein
MTCSKISLMTRAALSVALIAATVGVANDDGIGRFSDSYRYFASQPVNKSPSEWRAQSPSGISDRQLQAYSAASTVWDLDKPVFTDIASNPTFKQTHPNGLTEHELQALSSETAPWHPFTSTPQSYSAGGTNNETTISRLEKLFHPAN